MKYITYKILFLAIFFISHINMNAQRNVIWVHGLDGNANSWKHYNDIFDNERDINSLRQTYNTGYGINNMANQVILSIDNYYANKSHNPNNLAIGHSMGGVAIRDADRITHNTGNRFGGYITVTSPNYGAPISNSLSDGSVASAGQNAFNKIKAGPISEFFSLPWGIVANWTTTTLGKIYITNDLVEGLQGTPTTNNDLKQGSSAISAINNYTDNVNPNIPRISIWASENSPVHWRMFSTQVYGNDYTLVNHVNTARGKYDSFYHSNRTQAIIFSGLLMPSQAALRYYRAVQWKKGRDWIDNSETVWNSLIKSYHTEQQTYWIQVWVPCDNTYPPMKSTNSYDDNSKPIVPDPDCGEWRWVQRTRYVTINDPSDGLVPKYTQIMKNNPTPNSEYRVYGANHLEVRNMTVDGNNTDETYEEFKKIFNREDWFKTDLNPNK